MSSGQAKSVTAPPHSKKSSPVLFFPFWQGRQSASDNWQRRSCHAAAERVALNCHSLKFPLICVLCLRILQILARWIDFSVCSTVPEKSLVLATFNSEQKSLHAESLQII